MCQSNRFISEFTTTQSRHLYAVFKTPYIYVDAFPIGMYCYSGYINLSV